MAVSKSWGQSTAPAVSSVSAAQCCQYYSRARILVARLVYGCWRECCIFDWQDPKNTRVVMRRIIPLAKVKALQWIEEVGSCGLRRRTPMIVTASKVSVQGCLSKNVKRQEFP
jgi:hypothetical protein